MEVPYAERTTDRSGQPATGASLGADADQREQAMLDATPNHPHQADQQRPVDHTGHAVQHHGQGEQEFNIAASPTSAPDRHCRLSP